LEKLLYGLAPKHIRVCANFPVWLDRGASCGKSI
jgi:hypothetical protein